MACAWPLDALMRSHRLAGAVVLGVSLALAGCTQADGSDAGRRVPVTVDPGVPTVEGGAPFPPTQLPSVLVPPPPAPPDAGGAVDGTTGD
jgi:hypothetical protein